MIAATARPLLITTDAVGGVWSYSIALARGVAASGIPCVLAVLGPAATVEQRGAAGDIPGCTLVDTGLPLDWTVDSRAMLDTIVTGLVDAADRHGCCSAHLHAPALASQRWPIRVVAVAHSCMATWCDALRGESMPTEIDWHRSATADGLAAADEVIAPTKAFSDTLQRVYRPQRSIHVIHNGLPEPARSNADRRRFALAAGRLWDEAKNMGVLDAAAAGLDVPIHVAGPGSGPDGSQVEFQNLHRAGSLPRSTLQKLMSAAAMFVAPSLYEPFGLAVLEAAQQATPLVLSDIPTFRELWTGAAIFVPARDPRAWAKAIWDLAENGDRRAVLGEAAIERSRCYTLDAMVSSTIALHRLTDARKLRAA